MPPWPMFKLLPCRNYPAGAELEPMERLEHLRLPHGDFQCHILVRMPSRTAAVELGILPTYGPQSGK